jgi:hypothetical protein
VAEGEGHALILGAIRSDWVTARTSVKSRACNRICHRDLGPESHKPLRGRVGTRTIERTYRNGEPTFAWHTFRRISDFRTDAMSGMLAPPGEIRRLKRIR